MKKLTAVGITILLAGALGASCRRGGEEPAAMREESAAAVRIGAVVKKSVPDIYVAAGAVAPRGSSALSSKVMGAIIAVNVREGDAVRAGQTLVVIDSSDIETQVRSAESGLLQARRALAEVEDGIGAAVAGVESAKAGADLARKTYERYQELKDKKSVSQQEFDRVESQLKMSEAAVRQAGKQVDAMKAKRSQVVAQISQAGDAVSQARIMRGYATIAAPFDGVVVKKFAEPGQLATPGVPLVTIEHSTGYRLEAPVDESRLDAIRIGGAAVVEIPSLGSKQISGKIVEISQSADAMSRTFMAKIALPDDSRLRSGMFGRARFKVGMSEKILAPAGAVVRKGAVDGVFVIDASGAARFRAVKLGEHAQGGAVEVLSGVNPGDRIVVSGAEGLTDGRKVKEN